FGWLPLSLLYLHRACSRDRLSDYLLFAVFTVCQALASVYLAWMTVVAYVVFLSVEVLSRHRRITLQRFLRVVAALVLAGLIVVPISWPYVVTQRIFDFTWPMDALRAFSAVPADYLSVSSQNLIYGELLSRFANAEFANEHYLFTGVAPL